MGGFYRSTDGGAHWSPLTDQYPASQSNYLGGESIAPDPTDANIVYAAAGMYETRGNGVILRSTNQGASWTANTIAVPMGGNDTGRGMGERLAVDPNNNAILYFGSRGSGLYKSTNSGSTWTKVTAFPTTGDVAATGTSWGLPVVVFDKRGGSASGSTTIYVAAATTAAGSNLYHSADGGTTWAEIPGGPTGLMAHHASIGSDGTVWLAYGNNYGPFNTASSVKLTGQVWTYSAAGTWTNVTPPAANWGGMGGRHQRRRAGSEPRHRLDARLVRARSPAHDTRTADQLERHRAAADLGQHGRLDVRRPGGRLLVLGRPADRHRRHQLGRGGGARSLQREPRDARLAAPASGAAATSAARPAPTDRGSPGRSATRGSRRPSRST